ncbi:hypothetical protein FJZ23_02780 [Candidatus Parcubacteria bacterium]|nr:hypothetical protein [Candidatus Parcubacteria bacterium]
MPNDELFHTEPEAEAHAIRIEHGGARNQLAVQMLKKMRDSITHVIALLESGDTARAARQLVDLVAHDKDRRSSFETATGSRVVEGVFDGQAMVGADGARYDVPHNYASKSRLVEGDMLKLTIQPEGVYVYKQIGPVERARMIGKLHLDSATQEHVVHCGDQLYKVLAASITYHKGIPGDEVVVLVPRDGGSRWAAVESIVSNPA